MPSERQRGTGKKPWRASIRTACTAARYTHAASTHCSTWSPAAAVHQPDPAPRLSGSTSTPDHSSEDTKTLWFKLFLPLEFTWLAGLGCGRTYHWDTSSIQVGHAEAALAHGITLSERKAQINTNPAKMWTFFFRFRQTQRYQTEKSPSYQLWGFLKVLQGRLVILWEKLAAVWIHLQDEGVTALRKQQQLFLYPPPLVHVAHLA